MNNLDACIPAQYLLHPDYIYMYTNRYLFVYVVEQTVGEVIRMDVLQDDAPRKAWGRSPDSQVLRVLQEAELQPLTQLLGNVNICEEKLTGESLIYPPTHTYHYQPHSVQTQRLSANDSDWFPFRQLESDG